MVKRLMAFGMAAGFCFYFLAGCGSSSSTKPTTGPAPLVVTVGDVPLCNLVSFRSIVNGLTLSGANGAGAVEVFTANQTVPLDFAALRDTSNVLNITSIQPGTYTEGKITLIASEMSIFDPSSSPVIRQITPVLSSETVSFNINPPLVVPPCPVNSANPCAAGALKIDFNLGQSIPLDANGQISLGGTSTAPSAKITPVVDGTALAAAAAQGFGQMDDVHGYILSVSNSPTSSGTTNFIGSFVLQTLPGTETSNTTPLTGAGPTLSVNLPSASVLIGASSLNQLTTGNFVQVNGYVNANGSFVANQVLIEDQLNIAQQFSTFIGPIVSVSKDANGNVTSFSMTVTDEEPNTESGAAPGNPVPLDVPLLTVNVSASTGFHFSAPGVNYANLTPDPTFFAVGQRVIIHGTYVPPAVQNGATTLSAANIYIPLQTVSGTYASLLAAGSDNLTGGFIFIPCAGFFQGQRIYVVTSGVAQPNPTQFINLNGLAGLSPAPQLLIRGLLFFDQKGGAVNGIPIPANSYVMMASKVHQS
ncbi:MAG: hypothetical protein KGM47_14375 [Acidobacteriota bacterium]|nr:hypothetical protein [Acidobacteriota bacterium]